MCRRQWLWQRGELGCCDFYGSICCPAANTLTLVRLSVSHAAERVVYAALSNIYGVMGCAEDPEIIGKMSGSGLAACLGGGYLEIHTYVQSLNTY